ncbi:hypothetical protein CLV27_1584 [Phorcysia thermohydrogeniphila]|uniref:Uncharacterized protein n=1 Tax=Phorcysia thermohydrogeniphila TaxID=936138 RepID=A0A4R1GF71_9BACT|nr:hypothetical protein CLV27_1584 [Phorcysia thermohydrogeniphila]
MTENTVATVIANVVFIAMCVKLIQELRKFLEE